MKLCGIWGTTVLHSPKPVRLAIHPPSIYDYMKAPPGIYNIPKF